MQPLHHVFTTLEYELYPDILWSAKLTMRNFLFKTLQA